MWAIVVTEKPRGKPLWLRDRDGRMAHYWRRRDAVTALRQATPAAGTTYGIRPFWGEEIPT